MPLLKHINQFVFLFEETFRQLHRWRIWLVLAVYAALAWLVLYIHVDISSPYFFGLMKAWTPIFGSARAEGFFHYPGHYALLPYYFEWAKLILSVLLEGLFLGTAALLFYSRFASGTQNLPGSFRAEVRLWGQLVLASIVFNGLLTLVGWALPTVFAPLLRGYGRRTLAFEFVVMPFIYSLLLGLFYFAVPSIAIRGVSFLKGIGRSFKIFLRRPFMSFFLAAIVLLAPIAVAAVLQQTDTIINKFKPEMVYWLLVAGILADMVSAFLWMGTAARFLASEES
jgi:hypothetical protein